MPVTGSATACPLRSKQPSGAAIAPLMLHLWGLRTTVGVLGVVIGLIAVLGYPRMRSL